MYSSDNNLADIVCNVINHETAWLKYFPSGVILTPEGKICLNTRYTNPFRVDRKPGCNFQVGYKRKGYVFADFAVRKFYDIFQIVSLTLGLDYRAAILHLLEDEELYQGVSKVAQSEKRTEVKQCRYALFNNFASDYFYAGGITQETLEFFDASCAKYFEIDGEMQCWVDTNPLFLYRFDNTFLQCYRPLTKAKNKFRTNVNNGQLLNLNRLSYYPKDTLIITKSYKDIMVLHECGYPAVMTVGEATKPDRNIMDWLYLEYRDIVVIYDNDVVGKQSSEELCALFPFLTSIEMPAGTKDCFEFSSKYGITPLKRFLNGKIGNKSGLPEVAEFPQAFTLSYSA